MWIETETGRLVNAEFVRVFFITPLGDEHGNNKGQFSLRARNDWQDFVICEGSHRLCSCVKDGITHHIGQDSRWYYVSETVRKFNEHHPETSQGDEPEEP